MIIIISSSNKMIIIIEVFVIAKQLEKIFFLKKKNLI